MINRSIRNGKNSNLDISGSEYLYTLMIIFLTDSLLFGTNSNVVLLYGARYFLILFTLFLLVREITYTKKIDLILLFLSISILISSFLAGRLYSGYSYYTIISLLWFGRLFALHFDLDSFSYVFCKLMRIITIISLLGWLFASYVVSIDWLPIITNTVGNKYKSIIFTNIPVIPHHALRNQGPFWEPGVFQFYLNVAIYLTLFVVKNPKFKIFDLIIFNFALISTFSGAALVPMFLILLAFFFENTNVKSFIVVFLITCIYIGITSTGFLNIIFDKMLNQGSNNSIVYRWIGIEGSLKGFFLNPIFGSPPEVNEAIKSSLAIKYLGQTYGSNTNTFINYFAYYGVFVGSFMVIRTYSFFRRNSRSMIASLLVFGAYFISTSNENLTSSLLIFVLAFIKNQSRHVSNSSSLNQSLRY